MTELKIDDFFYLVHGDHTDYGWVMRPGEAYPNDSSKIFEVKDGYAHVKLYTADKPGGHVALRRLADFADAVVITVEEFESSYRKRPHRG